MNRAKRFGWAALVVAGSMLALAACSKGAPDASEGTATAVAADNIDTLTGDKLASFTGDAAMGATDYLACKTCHAIEPGVNKIGPSLHQVVGRKAGTVAGFAYSPANANSGVIWTPEKLFQFLEGPQRVMPGTRMSYAGMSDPQKRANVIAYLQTN